jgi:hypothetical protein
VGNNCQTFIYAFLVFRSYLPQLIGVYNKEFCWPFNLFCYHCCYSSLVSTLTSLSHPTHWCLDQEDSLAIKLVCCHHCHCSLVSLLTSFLTASSPSFHQSLFLHPLLIGVYTDKFWHYSPTLVSPILDHLLCPLCCGTVSVLSWTPNPDANMPSQPLAMHVFILNGHAIVSPNKSVPPPAICLPAL